MIGKTFNVAPVKLSDTTDQLGDNRPFLLSIALGLIFLVIWGFLYNAQFLEYDENFGHLGVAFLLSCGATVWLGILQWRSPSLVKSCRWRILLFLLLASPFTVIAVVMNYVWVFGSGIKL